MIPGHACNAYCAGDLHCDLVYSEDHPDERLLRYSVARHWRERYGVEVARLQDAREAPDLTAIPAAQRAQVAGAERAEAETRRWLLFWRAEGA